MAYLLDRDQDQRLEQGQIREDLYLSGLTDAADLLPPTSYDSAYRDGYDAGTNNEYGLITLDAYPVEVPLTCGQCDYFKFGECSLTGLVRSHNSYACPQAEIYTPF